MRAMSDPDVRKDPTPLVEAIAASKFRGHEAALLPLARRSVRLLHTDPGNPAAGRSRLGGVPDVPAGFVWPEWVSPEDDSGPRPLSFLIQGPVEADEAPFDVPAGVTIVVANPSTEFGLARTT